MSGSPVMQKKSMEIKQLDPVLEQQSEAKPNSSELSLQSPQNSPKQKKKRFKEGRRLRTIDPMAVVVPYIMKDRNDSLNYISDSIDITETERYIAKKRKQGYENFGLMHIFLAAYVRTVCEKPAVNRFIRGQRIYARNNIEICLTIKKEMTAGSPDTVVKFFPERTDTAIDIYNGVNTTIRESKSAEATDFDKLAKVLSYIPGVFFRLTVGLLKILDYWRLLPRALTKLSPFHGSYFITSMGSLGVPPIYHHIYNFGTVPLFTSFGAKRREYALQADGSVTEKKVVDYKIVMDERICDGFYYASALKTMRFYIKHPEKLDLPPKEIIEDIP